MLSGADVTDARQCRGDGNLLVRSLPLWGSVFYPYAVTIAPVGVVRFMTRQRGVDADELWRVWPVLAVAGLRFVPL